MVDKCRFLKIEDPTSGGTESNFGPTEADALEDHVACKGISFEGLDTFLIRKLGRFIDGVIPDWSNSVNYLSNGEVNYIEFFQGFTQTTPNRIARVDFTYDVNLDPSTEVWTIYDTDGTTNLKNVTFTHTFISTDYNKTEASE